MSLIFLTAFQGKAKGGFYHFLFSCRFTCFSLLHRYNLKKEGSGKQAFLGGEEEEGLNDGVDYKREQANEVYVICLKVFLPLVWI